MSYKPTKQTLTVKEAAEIIGVSVRVIRRLVKANRYKTVPAGRAIRIIESDFYKSNGLEWPPQQ